MNHSARTTPLADGGLLSTGIRKWLGKGTWAIADQALYGAANFGVNVLLARWLSADAYGAFAVIFATFFLLLAFYNALIVEPMLVFGPSRYRHRFATYVGLLSYLQLGLAVLGSLGLLITSGWLSDATVPTMNASLRALALVLPGLLFGWMMRRACYVRQEPRLAAVAGAAYSLIVLLGVWYLHHERLLSVEAVLYLMGGASLLAGIGLSRRLRLHGALRGRKAMLVDIARQHWIYGRWATATRVPMRLPTNIIYMVLPLWGGLAASGILKALLNVVQPLSQVVSALTVLLIPTLSRLHGAPSFFTVTRRMLLLFMLMTGVGWLALGLLGTYVVDVLYAGAYREYVSLLWLIGLLPVFGAVVGVLGAALRASEHPDQIFWAYLSAAGIGLPLTLGLMALGGLLGAAAGMVLMMGATALTTGFFYRRLYRRLPPSQPDASLQPARSIPLVAE